MREVEILPARLRGDFSGPLTAFAVCGRDETRFEAFSSDCTGTTLFVGRLT